MTDFNSTMQTYRQRYVGGGMRSNGQQPNQKMAPVAPNFAAGLPPGPHNGEAFDRGNENSSVAFYQNAAREGVNALGAQSAMDFRKALGGYLGNLNSIGALRSGAVESGANDIMDTYSRNFANAASAATLNAIGYGAQGVSEELGRQSAAADRKAQRKNSTIGAVGSLLGAGVGLL